MITLTIPGPPVGKQRARVCRTGHAFTPAKTVNYEALVKQTFAAKYPDFVPMTGKLKMKLDIFLMPSKQAARKLARGTTMYAPVRPDSSNVLKAIEDALIGLAYVDDKLICKHEILKAYFESPRVNIEIEELP